MRKLVGSIVLSFYAFTSNGQEIWTRPDKYFYEKGDTAKITFVTGEEFIASPVSLSLSEIASVKTTHTGAPTVNKSLILNGKKTSFTVALPAEGIYTYFIRLKPREAKLPGSEFLKYTDQYGLDEALSDKSKITDAALISFEKREVIRGFVRAGKELPKTSDDSETLPVELKADKNPLSLKKGEQIVFTVLKDGVPAFGAKVVIWNRWNNRTTIQHIWTQQDGTVTATISSPGDWMVTVVDLRKDSNKTRYIANSFNLVFGYR